MRKESDTTERARLVPRARGRVLEVGGAESMQLAFRSNSSPSRLRSFRFPRRERGYGEGPKPFSYLYKGVAEKQED
jgi:hypothetical protein